jgi:hypothetical protein
MNARTPAAVAGESAPASNASTKTPELQRSQGVERGNRCDECRPGEVVEAHHQPRLVAIQQTPQERSGDDAGEIEAEDDEAHRRTRARQLQHEPEQGDDGELVSEIGDAQPQPKALERGMAQWSVNSSGSRHQAGPSVTQHLRGSKVRYSW